MLNLLTNNTSASTATTCSGSSASNNSTSSSAAQQLLSQLSIAASQSNTTSAIGTCPSTPITKPLGINTNLANTQNMLFQNNAQQQQQMSPNSALKAKLGIQTTSSNYPLNSLQNQLNAFQKQQTAAAATTNASSSTNLLAAAAATLIQSLPNASNAASNLYNNHNHHNLNHQASVVGLNSHMHHPFAQMSPSTSASTNTASGGSSSSSSTCNLNNTLFVGNLHASLQEIDLIQVFRPFGRIVECCKKWLHFGFVKFTTEEEACHAYVTLNGFRLKGRPMRLEFQNRSKKAKIKAILAQAAAVHGVAAAGLMNLNGSSAAADFNLLSMGSNAQNAQTLAVAASFNSLLTAAATANASSSSSSNSTLDERHLLQQQFQNSTSASNSNMQHQQNQSQYFQQQQQQLQMSSNKQDQLLNSLFSSEQLLKFASSETNSNQQQQQQQHQSSVFQLQIPELNFDLISENQSIQQQQQQQNLYDFTELDLKLQVDDLHLQNHHHSQNSNFNFLDVNYSTSSGVSSSLSSSSSSSSSHQKSSSDDNIVMSLIKNTISPVESPKHDISSSLSTDSGCRSNSFLNDEDSAICSLAQTTTTMTINHTQKKGSSSSASSTTSSDSNKMMTKMEDFSEHLEFTCSNSSPLKSSALADKQQMQQNEAQKQMVNLEEVEDVEDEEDDRDVDDCSSDCDTSDDASDIPEEQEEDHQEVDEEQQNVQNSSIDSLNDLDLDQITNELHNLSACLLTEQKPEMQMYEALIKHSQVMDKDGCVKRMQLNPGCVYTSVNESHSLFIEPNDVLKKLEIDEVEEYNLFSPSRKQSQNLHDFVDHLLSSMRNQFYLGSN